MFTPFHLQTSPDRAILRALNGMRQISPRIPPIRPPSDASALSGRIIKIRFVLAPAPAVQS